ncbi:MAG: class I SAM-dependent methyltransferase, partial [Gammaproteobacteria bacterium]|nr:class I SAM-dependent methyltransferase [Gammaproteobacteria bacterium]
MASIVDIAESGWIPDSIVRIGIRAFVRQRLREEMLQPPGVKEERTTALRSSEIALHTNVANEQHYELPTEFFQLLLGPKLKYSACIFPDERSVLAQAEIHTLKLYEERLGVIDGDKVLDLGCGWGSFSIWLAKHNPYVEVTAVSNSTTQRNYIEGQVECLKLDNLNVITEDVNTLQLADQHFDKIISIEMFEHVRNYEALMSNICRWLKPEGILFVHIFCHKDLISPFEVEGESNWMGRYFFTGGLMPAADTLLSFQGDLQLENRWLYDGTHYERTARGWLENLDQHKSAVRAVLERTYRGSEVGVWLQR